MSAVYAAAAGWRRRWYATHPSRRRRLARPVVSVGNLRAGGSGKTPIVAYIARMLLENGEQPAVLTRGYARRRPRAGVTIVADRDGIRAGVDEAGDEPLMLAHALPGVPILVGADRYLSGRLAEERFGASVHILDDGFQHLALDRDVDLLLVAQDDLDDRPYPAGRLREGLDAAVAADAALVTAGYETAAERIARAVHIGTVFRVTRSIAAPRTIVARDTVVVPPDARVFVVSGIARPERFLDDVSAAGWKISGAMTFRDHHRFTNRDVRRIADHARKASSAIVLTTEKDAVKLAACDLGDLPIAAVPLVAGVEPRDAFRDWLLDRIRTRARRPAPGTQPPAPGAEHPAPRR